MRKLSLGLAVAAMLLIGIGAFVFARSDNGRCDPDILDNCGSDYWWRATEIAGHAVTFMPQTASEEMAPFADGSFYPKPADAAQAEAAIANAYGDLPGYRQYGGVLDQGNRYVLIIGFCQPGAVDWQEHVIDQVMSDPCGFRAAYDLGSDQLSWVLFAPDRQNPGAVDPA